MTLSEFKAWFEGFTESMEGAPTADQFAKIKAKVEKIDGAATTYPVFIDRYWDRQYRHWYDRVWAAGGVGETLQAVGRNDGIGVASFGQFSYAPNRAYADKGDDVTIAFDSHAAMRDLGKAEAAN